MADLLGLCERVVTGSGATGDPSSVVGIEIGMPSAFLTTWRDSTKVCSVVKILLAIQYQWIAFETQANTCHIDESRPSSSVAVCLLQALLLLLPLRTCGIPPVSGTSAKAKPWKTRFMIRCICVCGPPVLMVETCIAAVSSKLEHLLQHSNVAHLDTSKHRERREHRQSIVRVRDSQVLEPQHSSFGEARYGVRHVSQRKEEEQEDRDLHTKAK